MPFFDIDIGGEFMHAEFGLKRESDDNLFYKEWENDKGSFHFHSQIELYFVDGGEMEVTVGDLSKRLEAGEMSVALSFVPHGYSTPQASSSAALIIPTRLCEEFVNEIREKRAKNPFITDKATVERIRRYIKELTREGVNNIERDGYIYVILGILMDSLSFEKTKEPLDSALSSRILFYVNENFSSELSLGTLAAHFGYSESYISRYFKARFNVTFNKYLTLIRLKNAVMLMHEEKNSITYCALESGFSSIRSFYRAFYSEFGCTPKEYIRRDRID